MKKIIFLIGMILMLSGFCFAQDIQWNVANQATVSWNPITTLEDGNAVPEGSVISYEIFLIKEGDSRDDLTPVATIAETEYTFTFTEEGRFLMGIRSVRVITVSGFTISSDTSWSDDPAVVETDPFGNLYYVKPAKVNGLK